MKKIYIFIVILAIIFATIISIKDNYAYNRDILVLNLKTFPDFALRNQIKSCLLGERGEFSQDFSVTLYTSSRTVENYRHIKKSIESWGGNCTVFKETDQNIFDFRALGALSLYIFEDKYENIYPAFMSHNSEFFSTVFTDLEYDKAVFEGNFIKADEILAENICIVKK